MQDKDFRSHSALRTRQASIAKLIAPDAAMKVTTDAVQVFGGCGYTQDFPVQRYLREAEVVQIFEDRIQRLVIARQSPDNGHGGSPPAAKLSRVSASPQ